MREHMGEKMKELCIIFEDKICSFDEILIFLVSTCISFRYFFLGILNSRVTVLQMSIYYQSRAAVVLFRIFGLLCIFSEL